ncbi:MAG: DUF5063 domain-containing protein [Bacteroidales bacterium]
MTEIPDHPVYARNTLEFLTVCNDFCITVSTSEMNSSSLTDYLVKVLPLLYLKASLLPDIDVVNPDMNQRFVTQEEWQNLFLKLRKIFGTYDEFWYTDPIGEAPEPIKGSLSEHLADIFQDLQDFLQLYQRNSLDAKENALHEVSGSFKRYWGYQLVNAHKTLHHVSMQGGVDLPEEEFFGF